MNVSLQVVMALIGCEEEGYILTHCPGFLNGPTRVLEEIMLEHLDLPSRLQRRNVGKEEHGKGS